MSKIESSRFGKSKNIKNLSGQNITKLADARIIQKNLVYIIGISTSLANKETLSKEEYLGQYGHISKIVVNKNKAYNPSGPNGPSYSAYITYSKSYDAAIAILAIDNIEVDGHLIRASFGTTKYCSFFLKNMECNNKECLYQHHLADDTDIIQRDDMNSNKNIFYDQQILAMKVANIFNPEIRKRLTQPKKFKSALPITDTIYSKDIVLEEDPTNKSKKPYGKKFYKYDDFNFYEINNYTNDDVEYVLVRGKHSKNKNYYKGYKTIQKELSPERVTSTSDNGNNSNQNCSNEKNNNCTNKLYRKWYKSRFDFVPDKINIETEIPDFVSDMLYRKISRFTFFKNFISNKSDIKFFEKELTINNSWAQFIRNNISLED